MKRLISKLNLKLMNMCFRICNYHTTKALKYSQYNSDAKKYLDHIRKANQWLIRAHVLCVREFDE